MRRVPPTDRVLLMRNPLPGVRGLMALLWALAVALGGVGSALADQQDQRLEDLFARLQTTSSRAEAQAAQQQIWQIWIEADDSLANRLMRNGIEAMAARQNALALQYFDQLVEQAPDFAEGWNKRATVHYLMDDYAASVLDIERTLELEPRHFGALSGLGMIYDAIGKPAAALRSFEAAVAINPHLEATRQRIEALRRQLRGSQT
jgi:tetratricopeptide (TPR) repeat protein